MKAGFSILGNYLGRIITTVPAYAMSAVRGVYIYMFVGCALYVQSALNLDLVGYDQRRKNARLLYYYCYLIHYSADPA